MLFHSAMFKTLLFVFETLSIVTASYTCFSKSDLLYSIKKEYDKLWFLAEVRGGKGHRMLQIAEGEHCHIVKLIF